MSLLGDDTQSQMTGQDNASQSGSTRGARNATGWSSFQLSLHNSAANDVAEKMKNYIILDNGSSMSIFMNPDLVQNIREEEETLELVTNTGTMLNKKKADVPEFGTVWFDDRAIANIFGLCDLKKKYRVTYDSEIEDAFIVHDKEKGNIKFSCTEEGLYAFTPSESYRKNLDKNETTLATDCLIASVEENKKGYTERQFKRAKEARALYHKVGTPTVENFKALIRQNLIQNCPVTVEDIIIAEKIFGPDISSLKGKSTRTKPKPVVDDIIDIPPEIKQENKELVLCMDTMFINQEIFLTAIDKSIKFRSLVPLKDKSSGAYYEAIDVILRHYNKAEFRIKRIECDREYVKLMDPVSDGLDIHMNYTSTNDHVPEAERNNRVIKERVRATFHRLPYKMLPRVLIRFLAMTETSKLNYFPVKGGVSKHYSPRMILIGRTPQL